ncbi:hypothetical protein B0H17DRAFT_5488 [Mycena rosella]|uniref:Uncharacterized protein n=1 Tax=Mycena rosella TaxID=1033263 RepID=A0AAD7MCK2_MYCRO|nr:hypothetical protein B0H17DRAFT_5488 [Mycena rosella]
MWLLIRSSQNITSGFHELSGFGRQRQTANNEANLLKLCLDDPQIRVPTFLGLYSNTRQFGVVMSYAGMAIPDIFCAPDEQKKQIIFILKSLHRNGIHHHDGGEE